MPSWRSRACRCVTALAALTARRSSGGWQRAPLVEIYAGISDLSRSSTPLDAATTAPPWRESGHLQHVYFSTKTTSSKSAVKRMRSLRCSTTVERARPLSAPDQLQVVLGAPSGRRGGDEPFGQQALEAALAGLDVVGAAAKELRQDERSSGGASDSWSTSSKLSLSSGPQTPRCSSRASLAIARSVRRCRAGVEL